MMAEDAFLESKISNSDRFLAQCARAGGDPAQIHAALSRVRTADRAKRNPEDQIAPLQLTADDESLLFVYSDAQYMPKATGNIVERSGLIDWPECTGDKIEYCRELIRSATRKRVIGGDDLMTPNEHRALGVYRGWTQMYAETDEAWQEAEELALEAMPSVLSLTEAAFDEAFCNYPQPTVVYFHSADFLVEPRASLRVERLALDVAPYGRVARVNLRLNPAIWTRFMIITKPEPLFLFDINGALKKMISSEEPYEVIAAWFEPYVASMRRWMTDPDMREKLESLRALQANASGREIGEET